MRGLEHSLQSPALGSVISLACNGGYPMAAITRDDLRGANRLLIEAIVGTTDLAEAVHAHILGWPRRLLGRASPGSTGGIPGLAYAGVRGIARLSGAGIDLALRRLTDAPVAGKPDPRREALLAAINGVLGDRLAASDNPLAIDARLRHRGHALELRREALARAFPDARAQLLVPVHGLCMNDLQWRQGGHDHGVQLAEELGFDLVHLRYNSGLPIADNGARFSMLLQDLVDAWPMPVARIVLLGHSMGGLVARAAIASAQANGSAWLSHLDALVTLGTPYLGAPLERAGVLLQDLLGSNGYSAPFTTLGGLRSAGIRDLRHGLPHADAMPMPADVRTCLVAGSLQHAGLRRGGRHPRGDGLVPVASAFGEHRDPRCCLRVPDARKRLVHDTGHIALLGSAQVYAQLREWLAASRADARNAPGVTATPLPPPAG